MSFDLGVWFPTRRLSDNEARQVYCDLCDGDTSGISPNPAVEAFYEELISIHPEIDDIPEDQLDECPWNCALDHSSGHVIMPCAWSKSEYCYNLILKLAYKHGLAVFDPQSDTILYPDAGTKDDRVVSSKKPWWKFW